MITKTYLNTSDLSVLANWLRTNLVPDYFAAVTYGNNTLTCTDADGNTLLTINTSGAAMAYKSVSSTSTLASHIVAPFTYACKCANGAMIAGASDTSLGYMLITKTNNNRTAIVYSTGTSATVCRSDIKRVAWGDVQPDTTQNFTPITANQTQLVPFVTDAALGDVSYTPSAFYMPVGQYYSAGLGKFTADGYAYLTNGYWAIKDEAVS